MSKLQPVRGTRDIFGPDARRFSHVVKVYQKIALAYGFEEISTPIFEFTDVFKRTLGETSDVVTKEMYSFADRSGEMLTLRPEYTAGIARAWMSGGLAQHGVMKLFAHGPMFRYERPQKGRYRQFHQLDAEIIGAAEPAADIELLALAWQLLCDLGISDEITLHLNSLGDSESRAAYRTALVDYFSDHEAKLSDDSRTRLHKNPMRILDSKDPGDRALLGDAPRISDYLNDLSKDFFGAVCEGVAALDIPYTHDERLVRGLDYYSHTAFEFITQALGSQGTVLGGGRYDGLIELMGGPSTPGVGWAAGIERLA
ncbi:histidine--tRNA ligase [Iodidimonas gelatinilytica]|uniref:Histidine--tRNA ligase n=1 Tax=Iodidimonas gelatinilytica TaxID=1236966 RepID=A0A5A7MYI4_9PROT|nr:histidine--tRNA ligase [Iodidimonas gelatinilytica]GER01043.1 histidine--tRNA ligase [Iodidimonas gelatinilytica]